MIYNLNQKKYILNYLESKRILGMKVLLNQRQRKILEILSRENGCITSLEISKNLSISSKTVQNEIVAINTKYGDYIIQSKKGRGYKLKDNFVISSDDKQQVVSENRKIFIVKELVAQNVIDYYELADRLYISTSSLNKDIKELNDEISKKFNVCIVRKKNKLYFKGDDVKKQKVIVYYLLTESENADFDMSILESYFAPLDVKFIRNAIYEYVRERNIVVSDFELMAILLHILAAQLNQSFQENTGDNDFSKYLFKQTGLLLNEEVATRIEISLKLNNIDNQSVNYQDYKCFLMEIFDEIKQIYSINLKDDNTLMDELSLHLKYAERRCKANTQLKNPLIDEFRKKYVLVYDIAAFISSRFYEKTTLRLDISEVGYIAMHILGSLQKLSGEDIKIVLVNPYGKAVEKIILNGIRDISNVKYCGNFSFLDTKGISEVKPDLILTLVQLDWNNSCEVYRIEDYFNSNEYYAIEKIVKQIKVNNAYQSLAISECFNENLFLPEMSLQTRDEIIDLMCKRLYENNYVNENFRNQVYQREAVAPTCFSNQIAIPHSIKKDAKKSGICISILKEPILWNGYNVRLIFMFALNKSFDQVPKLYELILDAINDKTRYQKMLKCKNFKDFMSILMKGND